MGHMLFCKRSIHSTPCLIWPSFMRVVHMSLVKCVYLTAKLTPLSWGYWVHSLQLSKKEIQPVVVVKESCMCSKTHAVGYNFSSRLVLKDSLIYATYIFCVQWQTQMEGNI